MKGGETERLSDGMCRTDKCLSRVDEYGKTDNKQVAKHVKRWGGTRWWEEKLFCKGSGKICNYE